MSLLNRLARRESEGRITHVAITGAGLIGRGLVRQLESTRGLCPSLLVNRTVDRAVHAYRCVGHPAGDIVVSDDVHVLAEAIRAGRRAVTSRPDVLGRLEMLHVLVEVTGAVAYGAEAALHAIDGGLHVIMMNAETDATVGCALKTRADRAGVVYSNSDGDQPGVLKRLVDFVAGIGFDVVAAVNCKGFMDVHATPQTIAPWAEKQGTSLPMTTAFTDGTKMNIENAVLANATGLVPDRRGMHGVRTEMATALEDCLAAFGRPGVVDYTLGGNFGGGVFVIGRCEEPTMVRPFMKYLKMGDGPNYLFYRPYHLCHLETAFSIAEAVLDGEATIAPLGRPVAEVVAVAKRDLQPGEQLDGIGGSTCYGQIDVSDRAAGMLPVGLAEHARLTAPVVRGEPIALDAVELDAPPTIMQLRREQEALPAERRTAA